MTLPCRSQRLQLAVSWCVPLALAVGVSGCARGPEAVPAALEEALLRGDRAAVLALVDKPSQAMVDAALAAVPDRAQSPYWLASNPRPTQVTKLERGEAGVVVTVEAGGTRRGWVLVQEGGAWKVDLAATAAHRPWEVGLRDSK